MKIKSLIEKLQQYDADAEIVSMYITASGGSIRVVGKELEAWDENTKEEELLCSLTDDEKGLIAANNRMGAIHSVRRRLHLGLKEAAELCGFNPSSR